MTLETPSPDNRKDRAYIRAATKLIGQIRQNFWEEIDPTLFQNALRFAQDARGAAHQCPYRKCRAARACQTTVREGERLDCGASVPDETLAEAARLTVFAHVTWFDRWWHGIVRRSEK